MKKLLAIDSSGRIDWPESARRVLEMVLQAYAVTAAAVGIAVAIVTAVVVIKVLLVVMWQVTATVGAL